MKTHNYPRIILSLFALFCSSFLLSQEFPQKTNKLVNDYAGIIDKTVAQKIEYVLTAFEKSHGFEVVVVTVNSLEDQDIAMYVNGLAEQWGIGKKELDNGVIMLVAPNERKMNISTGYGVEAMLTDALCKRIITQVATPYFKNGDYSSGIIKSTEAVLNILNSETPPSLAEESPKQKKFPISSVIIFLIIIFFAFLRSAVSRKTTISRNGRHIASPWALTFLVALMASNHRRGSGGSGFGGNSGFGGFGGGGFGGGGASGSW